jgi:transposase
MLNAASHLPEDPALLKAMIAELQDQNAKLTMTLRAHDLVVQALRLQISKLKKQAFGKSSEKIQREIEQLELALEDVLVSVAQQGLVAPVSRQTHRANATNLIPAAPARIAGATCASWVKT